MSCKLHHLNENQITSNNTEDEPEHEMSYNLHCHFYWQMMANDALVPQEPLEAFSLDKQKNAVSASDRAHMHMNSQQCMYTM